MSQIGGGTGASPAKHRSNRDGLCSGAGIADPFGGDGTLQAKI
jgi:hypothetical protein